MKTATTQRQSSTDRPEENAGDKRPGRNRKMALCLSSYKRFEDLQRQIYCMMHQSYRSFHLFVAVKGVSSFIFESILIPQFREWIDEGRLTLRWFPNKNQLSNLIDTVRGLDIDDYDLFLKIDDDDFYSRDYLEVVHEFHSRIPEHHCSYYSDWGWVHYKYGGISSLKPEYYAAFGATMALSRPVMERLIACEKDPGSIADVMRRWTGGDARVGFIEDNFIHKLMVENGCSNRAPYLRERPSVAPHIIVQKANASVTRGDMLDGTFQRANEGISHDPATFEYVVGVRHPQWSDSFRIFGERGRRVSNGDAARVVRFSPETLVVHWEKWGVETFTRRPSGNYELETNDRS